MEASNQSEISKAFMCVAGQFDAKRSESDPGSMFEKSQKDVESSPSLAAFRATHLLGLGILESYVMTRMLFACSLGRG